MTRPKAVLATVIAVLAACAHVPSRSGPSAGSGEVIGGPVPPPEESAPAGSVAVVSPVPGLVDVRPTGWTEVQSSSGGRRLLVSFWSTPCTALDHVDVRPEHDRVVVTLYEGVPPAQRGKPCVQLAEYRAVAVELEEPLAGRRVVDGASSQHDSPSADEPTPL